MMQTAARIAAAAAAAAAWQQIDLRKRHHHGEATPLTAPRFLTAARAVEVEP
jgi:hypothetical protein